MKLSLTTGELKLANILLYVKNVEIRFAGGWVRDKLLGSISNDIDVALDGMTGQDFVNLLQQELRKHHEENLISHIGKIAINPDQSKHLETVTGKVCGFECDFVNLRNESYALHSRIPEMAFGTAKEDALRRDFTINSLFYNLNSQVVEDLTGHGISDLKSQLIRTPLDARTTFKDDPLRALRAIRFASRLKFKICPEIIAACHDNDIQQALATKVSHERIVIELNKMLSSQHPDYGFYMLHHTELYDAILPKLFDIVVKQHDKKRQLTVERQNSDQIIGLGRILKLQQDKRLLPIEVSDAHLRTLYLSILYAPYAASLSQLTAKSCRSFVDYFTTVGLKFSKKDNQLSIDVLYKALKIKKTLFDQEMKLTKKQFGLLVRHNSADKSFDAPFLLAAVLYLQSHFKCQFDSDKLQFHDKLETQNLEFASGVVANIFKRIQEYGFGDIAHWTPILNGQDIKALKPLKGEAIGEAINLVLEYQIENHPVTIDQAKEWFIKQ